MYNKIFISVVLINFSFGQVGPEKSLHRSPPRAWALTNATIHTEPGKTIYNGTIVIRDGLIIAVGKKVKIPAQVTAIKMNEKHIYAGFIESWMDVESKPDTSSLELHWNSNMRAHLKASDIYKPSRDKLNELRELGFTTAHIAPDGGIFQGRSSLVQISNQPKILSNEIAQIIEFKSGGWGAKQYPTSLLGAIAFVRQGFIDAEWYGKSQNILSKYPDGNEQIQIDQSLNTLNASVSQKSPFIFKTNNEIYIDRAFNISEEFDIKLWIKGSGFEYRRIAELPKAFMIIPVNFPAKPDVTNPHSALQYSTKQLKHWDIAPDNLMRLKQADFLFSITTSGLKTKGDFRNNLSKAVRRGFSKADALASLTTLPADAFGQSERLGKIKPGYIANLVVTDGSYFNIASTVKSVWIGGEEFEIDPDPIVDAAGIWTVKERERTWVLEINKADLSYSGIIKKDGKSISVQSLSIDQDRISFGSMISRILTSAVTF